MWKIEEKHNLLNLDSYDCENNHYAIVFPHQRRRFRKTNFIVNFLDTGYFGRNYGKHDLIEGFQCEGGLDSESYYMPTLYALNDYERVIPDFDSGNFLLTGSKIPKLKPGVSPGFDSNRWKIAKLLQKNDICISVLFMLNEVGSATSQEIADENKVSHEDILKDLLSLIDVGLITVKQGKIVLTMEGKKRISRLISYIE